MYYNRVKGGIQWKTTHNCSKAFWNSVFWNSLAEPTYGYEIVMHLKQVGFSDLSESTLYPLLLRLEQQERQGERNADLPKGPRKYYVVTEEGRKAL